MPPAPGKSAPSCPNCHAALAKGARICSVCKLEVAKMPAYAAAKRAAQTRGIKTTSVENRTPLVSTGTIVKTICFLLLIGGIAWTYFHFFGPKPPRYLKFPGTALDSATALLTHISAGTDPEFENAYFLVADSARDPHADDERGDYLQIFNVMNLYLSGEFGDNWINQTQFAADPKDPNLIIAKVALETLHIHVAQQSPPDKLAAYGPHFGITGIDEFDTNQAAEFRKMAGIEGIVKGVAGQGAVNNLEIILGANAANRRVPPMVKKVDLLSVNRNPRTATWRSILQMYPFRQDPVVRGRLAIIVTDQRYDPAPREKAKAILDDKVAEEELISVGL